MLGPTYMLILPCFLVLQWSYDASTKKLDNRETFWEFEDEKKYPLILPPNSNQGYIEFDISSK